MRPDRLFKFGVTPSGSFLIAHEKSALHVHSVFSLRDEDVGEINALFASTVYYFWKYLEENWELVCSDIEKGKLSDNLLMDNKIRNELDGKLTPKPKRAFELRSIFNGSRDELAKKIWPNLVAVKMITTGTFSIYHKTMKKIYMKNVDTYSLIHSCNECHIGIGLEFKPDSSIYILNANYAFFEFIHERDSVVNRPNAILPSDVIIGENYEVVVTNNSGLYRYRTGDLITIISKQPYFTYKLLNRRQSVLDINGKFLSENIILQTIDVSSKPLDLIITDGLLITSERMAKLKKNYQHCPLPHYLLFIETIDGSDLTIKQKSIFDDKLKSLLKIYDELRNNDTIGELNVVCTKKNTFYKLRDVIGQENNMAFKMPRLEMESDDVIHHLIDNSL